MRSSGKLPFTKKGNLGSKKFFYTFAALFFVRWCNGSTADFGSACSGSNPDGTTDIFWNPLYTSSLEGIFIFRGMNIQDMQLIFTN